MRLLVLYDIKYPNLETDESFHVWIQTASLPQFSKLAMRNNDSPMRKGRYEIEIWDGKIGIKSGIKSEIITN
jgi:LEM3 (ligand-effect modulator 3) family / CDC50 family